MGIQIGVDGGGSKTEIVVLDKTGRVLRCLRKPATNYHVVGIEQAVRHIIEGIGEALQEEKLEGIGISLAGIDTPKDWEIMADGLKKRFMVLAQKTMIPYQEVPLVLENDSFGALMSVKGEFSGNVLAVGTGAVALGVNPEGEVFRVGGWGPHIGDQGSGYDIGRKALTAMVASFDGYGPKSSLETTITEHLGLVDVHEISDWFYRSSRKNNDIAALAPVVVETARTGDLISKLILVEAGRALGLLTGALLRKTKGRELGLVGGIVNIWESLEPSFQPTLQEEFAGLRILKPIYPPAVGAALLSRISQVRRIIF